MKLETNRFKAAITADQPQVGIWSSLCSNLAAEVISTTGFDWVLIDMEHSPNELGDVLSKEIMDRFHTFMDAVDIARGHMKGDTSLPLPPATIMDESTKKSPGTASASTGSAGMGLGLPMGPPPPSLRFLVRAVYLRPVAGPRRRGEGQQRRVWGEGERR